MFKKIYYINLEHRLDRKNNVELQLKKINCNCPVERINAAYGKNLDLKTIPKNLFTEYAKTSTKNKSDINNTQTMTKGGMGVAMSQKWIYEKVLFGKEDYVLILEDDIEIPDNFIEKLKKSIAKIPEYDMLWLGYHTKINLELHKDYDVPYKIWGLFGYIINKKAAKHLLEIFPLNKQIDSEIPRVFNSLKVYALKRNNRLIFSDLSQDSFNKFGTDIQFNRESFGNVSLTNNTIIIISIFVILLTFILYKQKI